MRALAILSALALAGCGHVLGKPAAPVPVSCVPKEFPGPPSYTDGDAALKAAPDFAARYQLLAGNRFAHQAREQALESIVSACR